MKAYIGMFVALLAVMLLVPFMNLGKRGSGEGPVTPPPTVSKQDTPSLPPPSLPPASGGTPSASVLPYSSAEQLKTPMLLYDEGTGKVVKMSQQEYVLGAVCSEMPPRFHVEAIKAQAVAAHSYALRCKRQEQASPDPALHGAYLRIDAAKRNGYVSEATVREMYGDKFDIWYPVVKEAVAEVSDQILVYGEEPIVAAYHAISAGTTEDAQNVWTGSADYLVPVESPGDRLAPDYETEASFTVEQARKCLKTAYADISLPNDASTWFADLTRSPSGYVTQAKVGDTVIPGQTLRNIFGLRSSYLDIACDGQSFTFTVTGYGHGVGMSQYGADYMARQGSGYAEILAHYYTESTLVRLR